jgi:hypothetical protein
VNLNESDPSKALYLLETAGHGHYSGKNGEIYSDMSGFTTATADFYRVVLEVESAELEPNSMNKKAL